MFLLLLFPFHLLARVVELILFSSCYCCFFFVELYDHQRHLALLRFVTLPILMWMSLSVGVTIESKPCNELKWDEHRAGVNVSFSSLPPYVVFLKNYFTSCFGTACNTHKRIETMKEKRHVPIIKCNKNTNNNNSQPASDSTQCAHIGCRVECNSNSAPFRLFDSFRILIEYIRITMPCGIPFLLLNLPIVSIHMGHCV